MGDPFDVNSNVDNAAPECESPVLPLHVEAGIGFERACPDNEIALEQRDRVLVEVGNLPKHFKVMLAQ